MTRFSFASLRTRLLLLVLLAILPALGLILYTGLEQRRLAAADVRREALRLTQLAASKHEELIGDARQLLLTLARLPEVRGGNPAACSSLLADLLEQDPRYTNFGAADPRGNISCSAVPFTKPTNVADRAWFQRAVQTHDFATGDYQVGRITGKAILVFGYPILGKAGQVQAVVYAALDLAWLGQFAAKAELPEGEVLLVTDRNGTILARYPNPEQWVGQTFPEAGIVKAILTQREGGAEVADVDGIPRLFTFIPLHSTSGNVYLSTGISKEAAFATVNRALARNLTLLGLVAVLALLAAWSGGTLFILRQVKALVNATQRLATGDLSARTGLSYGPGELGQLARAFDEMAESLEQGLAERKRAEATRQALYRASLEIQAPLSLQERLAHLLQTAQTVLELDRVNILLADSGGQWLQAVASTEPEEPLAAIRVPIGPEGGGIAQAYLTQQMLVWDGQAPVPEALRLKPPYDRIAAFRSRVFALLPLVVQGRAIGVLGADRKHSRRPFDQATLDLLQPFATQAALAIEQARLYEQAQARGNTV